MTRLGQTKEPFNPASVAVARRQTHEQDKCKVTVPVPARSGQQLNTLLGQMCYPPGLWTLINFSSIDLASSCVSPHKPLASTKFQSSVTRLAKKYLFLFVLDLLPAHFSWFPLALLFCGTGNNYSIAPLSMLFIVSRFIVKSLLCSFCSILKSPRLFNHLLCTRCFSFLTHL